MITFLSDFGLDDGYVGVVKGVILSIAPEARIVDLSHLVPPQNVAAGAFVLETAVEFFPAGTIHLAVVDPGVGARRRAVALLVAGHYLVGPDNGLLSPAVRRLSGLAVAGRGRLKLPAEAKAVRLTNSAYWRHPVSRTFHARDIFGPAAAHLASGAPLGELGQPIRAIAALPQADTPPRSNQLEGAVRYVDRFGNLITDIPAEGVPSDADIQLGQVTIHGLSPAYGVGSKLVALVGSSGHLEIALPRGSAAAALGLAQGAPVRVSLKPNAGKPPARLKG